MKKAPEARTYSIHRLVQTQFLYYLPFCSRQQAFNHAVKLVYESFPQSNAQKGQLYDHWEQCTLYSQHVLALKNNYKKESQDQTEPLKSSIVFCKLLKNYSRFVLV